MNNQKRIRTTQAREYVGQRVRLAGWLHRLRRLGGINFLVLRDGFGLFQAVIDTSDELVRLRNVLPESVIEVEGVVVAERQAPGGLELHDCRVRHEEMQTLPFVGDRLTDD